MESVKGTDLLSQVLEGRFPLPGGGSLMLQSRWIYFCSRVSSASEVAFIALVLFCILPICRAP